MQQPAGCQRRIRRRAASTVRFPLLPVSADPDTSLTVSYACRLRAAVVLAAGNSERLRAVTGDGSKPLLRVGGMPLIERTVRMATRVGVERIVVVTGHDAERIAHTAEQACCGRVVVVRAPDWELANGCSLAHGCSLAAAAAVVGEEPMFLLLNSSPIGGLLPTPTMVPSMLLPATMGCSAGLSGGVERTGLGKHQPPRGRYRQRTSTRSLIPVLSCPSSDKSMKDGMHTRSRPPGAT